MVPKGPERRLAALLLTDVIGYTARGYGKEAPSLLLRPSVLTHQR